MIGRSIDHSLGIERSRSVERSTGDQIVHLIQLNHFNMGTRVESRSRSFESLVDAADGLRQLPDRPPHMVERPIRSIACLTPLRDVDLDLHDRERPGRTIGLDPNGTHLRSVACQEVIVGAKRPADLPTRRERAQTLGKDAFDAPNLLGFAMIDIASMSLLFHPTDGPPELVRARVERITADVSPDRHLHAQARSLSSARVGARAHQSTSLARSRRAVHESSLFRCEEVTT